MSPWLLRGSLNMTKRILLVLCVAFAAYACEGDDEPTNSNVTGGFGGSGATGGSGTGGSGATGGSGTGGSGTGGSGATGGSGTGGSGATAGTGGSDDGGATGGTGGDGGTGGVQDAGPGCFTNPTTHLEIINACTDAEKVDK